MKRPTRKTILVVAAIIVAFSIIIWGSWKIGGALETQPQHIQGVVADVKYLPTDASFGGIDYTIVKFDDGRIKSFPEINDAIIFQTGKMNVITYKDGCILSVEIK